MTLLSAVMMASAMSRLDFCSFDHFFLDRVARDEPIGKRVPCLSDTMGAIDGLCFNSRIPPWIQKEDVLAEVRFNPSPPAFRLMRKTGQSGES